MMSESSGQQGLPGSPEWCTRQLWAFARQAPDHALLLLDVAGIVHWASPGASRILGESVEELAGRDIERFFTPEDVRAGIPAYERTVATGHGSAEDNRWMRRSDGAGFWASGAMVALRDERGSLTGFAKAFRNLTDIKMRLAFLRNSAAAASDGDARKTAAIATISHELRNPLSSIRMAESVLRELSAGDTRLQAPLGVIDRSVGFATRLIEDLEDASRHDTGKVQLQPEPLLLHEVLETSIAVARERTGSQRPIALLLPPGEPVRFEADLLRIQQVFVNLIANAIKYTPEPGGIWVKGSAHGPRLLVRVEDEGVGIDRDMIEKIFGMFTQAPNPVSKRGLGIGLALVRTLVTLHGGTVEARSDGPGKGSTFSVWLPLQAGTTDGKAA
jgi:two-component system CheB/CheR fusion protein